MSLPLWGAIQTALENAGIEFSENGAVRLVSEEDRKDGAAVYASPSFPNQARRAYGY